MSSEASNLVDPPVNPEIFCLLNGPTITTEGLPPAFQTFLITSFNMSSVIALGVPSFLASEPLLAVGEVPSAALKLSFVAIQAPIDPNFLAVEESPATLAWLVNNVDSMSLFSSLDFLAIWYASSLALPALSTDSCVPVITTVLSMICV